MTIRPEIIAHVKNAVALKSQGLINCTDAEIASVAGVSASLVSRVRVYGSTTKPKAVSTFPITNPRTRKAATVVAATKRGRGRPPVAAKVRKSVARDYIDNILSLDAIATKYGVSKSSVYRWGQEELNKAA